MTAPVPTRRPAERFALDGYRALAAVAVLTFHAYQFNRGRFWPLEGTPWHGLLMSSDLAVDMFFVLSGLLLGLPFARAALGGSPARSARMFLLRRFARILPLYLTVVLLVWTITNPELPGDWRDLLLHLTFTQVYSDAKIFYTDGPAWTLACEAHFFVLLAVLGPLAVQVAKRRAGHAGRYAVLIGGIAVLMAVSIGYRVWAVEVAGIGPTTWSVWFSPLARLDVFAIGLLLGVVVAEGRKITSALARRGLLVAAVAVVAVSELLRPPGEGVSVLQHTVAGLGCALVLAASTLAPREPRWLRSRFVVFLGTISYGLYLWQEPVQRVLAAWGVLPEPRGGPIFLLTAAIVFVATIGVATVSYRVVERTGVRVLTLFDAHGRHRDYYPEPGPPPPPLAVAR